MVKIMRIHWMAKKSRSKTAARARHLEASIGSFLGGRDMTSRSELSIHSMWVILVSMICNLHRTGEGLSVRSSFGLISCSGRDRDPSLLIKGSALGVRGYWTQDRWHSTDNGCNTELWHHIGGMTGFVLLYHNVFSLYTHRKISNISRTKSQNLNVSRLGLHLSLCNILKPSVKWRMNM